MINANQFKQLFQARGRRIFRREKYRRPAAGQKMRKKRKEKRAAAAASQPRLTIKVAETLYLRDPDRTALGRAIVSAGISLFDQLGFEEFTFKKLALEIPTTEASIYRYFPDKACFLRYLLTLYWGLLEYRLRLSVHSLDDSREKMSAAISLRDPPAKAEGARSNGHPSRNLSRRTGQRRRTAGIIRAGVGARSGGGRTCDGREPCSVRMASDLVRTALRYPNQLPLKGRELPPTA